MITSTNQAQSASTLANLTLSLPSNAATGANTTDPFAQQLASVLEQFLGESSGSTSSQLEINITKSQVSDGSQLVVTITDPNSTTKATANATANATTSPSTATTTATSAVSELMPSPAGTTPATYTPPSAPASLASASTAATGTIDKSKMTPDDAYWAEQPPAVQALRNMPDADRSLAAMQLAQQGYSIDVPIMVWGWDPLTTMVERQNYGYTWVPSALQPPVQLPPGLSFPGLPTYDANNPPAGSIKVTTDFAKGTNMQDVFVDPATIQASFSGAVTS